MTGKAQRKELLAQYKQNRPPAGVYRIVNARTDKALLGSTTNLASIRGKLNFARATNTPSALDHRLGRDASQFGIDVFAFEVLEVLEIRPEMTSAQIQDDLSTLEALWRERFDHSKLY